MPREAHRSRLVLLLELLAFALALAPAGAFAQGGASKVVLVRHAEFGKSPTDNLGPSLSEAGAGRARVLAERMASEGVILILTTPFRRTRETATFVGDKLKLMPVVTAGADAGKIVDAQAKAIREAAGGTVLVVGHADTIPALIARLGGPRVRNLCENGFDRMFTLTGLDGTRDLMVTRYGERSPDPRPNCS